MTDDIHVVPVDDILPHDTEGTDCWCDPRIEVIGANLLIVHNSFDGREEKESAQSSE